MNEQPLLDSLIRLNQQQKRELEELLKNEDNKAFYRTLMDETIGTLTYLCNFDKAVSENGHETDMADVTEQLEVLLTERFEKLTGTRYTPHVCRR